MKMLRKPGMPAAVLLAAALLFSGSARASGSWMTFTADSVPEEQAWVVQEYSGTVRITFLGDCTLGGEEEARSLYRGFDRTIERNGYAYPFRNLTALTASDDLTVANLEGVLSDRTDLKKVDKTYNFMGTAAYTEILKEGSVECVTLANNHSRDYGPAGYMDTVQALENAGVAWFGTDSMAVWRSDEGLMIGFLGVAGSLSGDRYREHQKQAEVLRSIGCAAVITVMHAGQEYVTEPGDYQHQIVRRTIASGVDLVIGHHPHIVQGYEIRDGVPVVYSLGNCVFGGNTNPRDHDALAVQADLAFEDGGLAGITLHFYPVSVSGEEGFNDYSPVLLAGEDAARVLLKMEKSTGNPPGAFREGQGAAVTVPAP
ncbi:MAG: CapA family protein [Clostridia bacterium]|nr:CapA family protein [Clostridia bacterium]